jgi:hypothetical protein
MFIFLIACTPVQQQPEPTIIPTEVPVSTPVEEKTQVKAKTIVIVEQPPESGDCSELGCPIGTALIGDGKTNLYYECRCTFVRWIKPEHLFCFDSAEEAKSRGFRQAESC